MKRALLYPMIILVLAAAAALAPNFRADEGVDPMRVVYMQQVHPVLLLVCDVSGSMSFPIDTSQGQGSSDWDSDSNYAWYKWKWSSSLAYGQVRIYADDTIPSAGYAAGEGQGCWVLGANQGKGALRSSFNTIVYSMGNYLGWGQDTQIYLSGCPDSADDGLYKLADAPSQSGADGRYWFFRVYKKLNGNTWETSYHVFSSLLSVNNITIEVPSGNGQAAPAKMWLFAPPSRMAVLKNVLGNSINTYSPLYPTGTTTATSNGKTYYLFGASAGPASTSRYYDYTAGEFNAPAPVMLNSTAAPDPVYTLTTAPKNLVGNSSVYVDWGLMTFAAPGGCTHAATTVIQQAVADDAAQAAPLVNILTHLGPVRQNGQDVGLNALGGTPTRQGLQDALSSLQSSYSADETDCIRGFSSLLVTDGESNCGNPSGGTWSSCPTDSGTSSDYNLYPPGIADANWTNGISKGSLTANVRTYVIGVSSDVSKCELNWTAYYGRTDASQSDVGYNTDGDPRLPSHPYDYSGVNSGHNYAFFADTAQTLIDGIGRILSTMGGGDYTTSPPIVAASLQADGAPYALLGSTEFSSLRGHLYAYDTSQPQAPVFKWDAGLTLESQSNATRKIYTWNPSTNALVEITAANAATINTIAQLPANTITANIVDFMRGNNGIGAPRAWKLGPILNVTPSVIGAPDVWNNVDSNIPDHSTFSGSSADGYANRHPLVYVGASDGMIHAFDLADGSEIIALIPPNNLANQVRLYDNYVNGGTATGEPTTFSQHVYGVSSSPRFADVYFPAHGSVPATYKTCLFITEGPGGNDTTKNLTTSTAPRSMMSVIDVTHPYPGRIITWPDGTSTTYNPDHHYDAASPVTPLGQIDTNANTSLQQTWSVPTIGWYGGNNPDQGCILTSGFTSASTVTSQISPSAFVLDPSSYSSGQISVTATKTLAPHSSGNIVGDQVYAGAVFWKQAADQFFNPAHKQNQGVIADLSGQIWFLSALTNNNPPAVGIDVGAGQPVYYSPAVAYYNKDSTHQYDLYAFASGSFYEKSPNVTAPAACTNGGFCPTIYISALNAITPPTGTVYPTDLNSVWSKRLTDIVIDSDGHTLSDRAQVVSSPTLFLPANNVGDPFALFLIYDAGSGACAGDSYVLQLKFQPANLQGTSVSASDIFHASTGVAGGLAISGGSVIVSVSGVGQGQRATVVKVPDITVGQQSQGQRPLWWIELK